MGFITGLVLFWRRKWQPTAVFLLGETHGQRSLQAVVRGVTGVGLDSVTKPPPLASFY